MKKIFTLISLVCLCVANAVAAKVTTVTDIEKAVTDGTVVTLCIGDQYLYGSDAQNVKMGDANTAVAATNGCIGYKMEKDGDNYMFRCVTPAGEDYFIWGRTECNYLNAQPSKTGVTFNLNINGTQKGTDMENGAVWSFEKADGKLYLKNVGNGAYFAGTQTKEEAVEVSVVTIEADPVPEEKDVEILAALKPYVEKGTVFCLKTGDQYLYGSKAQECAMGTLEEATAETAAVTGWKLEYEAKGGRYILRAITPAGENYKHDWAKGDDHECFLNCQPAINGVTFILGKNQDVVDGSSWIIEAVEGGYTIQNMANKGYLTGLALSETPVVWQIVVPGAEDPKEDPKDENPTVTIPEGSLDIATLTGTNANWASTIAYPMEFKVQGAAFGDGDGSNEATHVSVAGYDKATFVVTKGSPQGLALRVWMWDGSKVVTLFAQPEADEATADYTKEYLIKEAGNYVVKFNGLETLKGVKAANNWGSDPIYVGVAYVTPKTNVDPKPEDPKDDPKEDPKDENPTITIPEGSLDIAILTGTNANWASTIAYPMEFKVQGAAFGDGDGSNEATHVSVAGYDKVTFVVTKGSAQGLALRVWMWDGSQVVTLYAQPEADEATADYTKEYLIKEAGNYVVKFNGLETLKGVKAANNWGSDPIYVGAAYVTPEKGISTSINAVAAGKVAAKAVKVLVNGKVVIVGGNDKVNVVGQLVK